MKSAVCYFSQTGNTKNIADKLAQTFDSDVITIVPDEKYGGMLPSIAKVVKDRFKRHQVKLKNNPPDLSDYDVIFLGFPVWAGTMPEFVQEFLQKSNIGKQHVIPFVTAMMTGEENSYNKVVELLPEAEVSDYFFTNKKNERNLDSWIETLKEKLED